MSVNDLLHREILPGKQFDALIPKVKCQRSSGGDGNTDHSIKKMVEWINQYSWQMSGVAALLQRGSLEETVDAVHDFCFDHFQYRADEADQQLRSPACSWYQRYNGIDCKSYSIVASAIFTEMGISHYIRKIIQPATAEMWTEDAELADAFSKSYSHVYVIVPANQSTGDLNDGHYVCDGTIYINQEPTYTNAKDEFMRHIMLNGAVRNFYALGDPTTPTGGSDPAPGTTPSNTTPGYGTQVWNAAVSAGTNYVSTNSGSWFKKISFKSIGKLLKTPIGCWGGTAFTDALATQDMDSVSTYLTNVLNQMNDALKAGNMQLFSDKVNEYMGMSGVFVLSVTTKYIETNWNTCSRHNLNAMIEGVSFYFNGAMDKSLDAYLAQFFVATKSGRRTYNSGMSISKGIMPFCSYTNPMQVFEIDYEVFTLKPGSLAAPAFLPTPYVFNLIQTPGAFNADSFLATMADAYGIVMNPGQILGNIGSGTGTGTGTGSGTGAGVNNGGTTNPNQPEKKPFLTAGTGAVLAIVAIGFAYGLNNFGADKPAKKQTKAA